MITATTRAIKRIAELKEEYEVEEGFLKISLNGGGCSGFVYQLEFTNDVTADDRMIIIDEETDESILVDRKSYLYLNGMEIDYEDNPLNGGFKFKVPGARECGCGMSFSPG